MGEPVGAIDCGTNSVKLLITTPPDVVLRDSRVVRLGQGVDTTGRLADEALARTFTAIDEFAGVLREHGVPPGRTRFCATSATRDAANAAVFVEGVRVRLGVTPEVLSGPEEAALVYAGAVGALSPMPTEPVLVVDIGGGSTELILGDGATARASVSLDIGCVRLFERHLHGDPPHPAEVAALRADVAGHLLAGVAEVLDPAAAERVVGVAGTVTTVTAIALGLDAYDPRRIHHQTVDAAEIGAVAEKLAAMTVAERAAMPVMAKGREDVIAAGALLLDELVRSFRLRAVTASETDILDGVLLGLADRPDGG